LKETAIGLRVMNGSGKTAADADADFNEKTT
jgi:hypothetical protein